MYHSRCVVLHSSHLLFNELKRVQILRNSQPLASVRVDNPASPPKNAFATPVKPATTDLGPGLERSTVESIQWASPAFLRSSRQSLGGFPGPIFDPFAEEDGYVPGKGRKRPRFSMRSNEWRLVDEPASPGEENTTWDESEDLDMQADEDEEAEQITEEHISKANGEESQAPEYIDAADVTAPTVITEESTSIVGIPEHRAGDKAPSRNLLSQRVHDTTVSVRTNPQVEVTPTVAQFHEQHLIRVPTDTSGLLPLPSPGLIVPSPLVAVSPNLQSYFPTVGLTGSTESPALLTGHGEDVTTAQNAPVQETPAHDLSQQTTEKVLENATVDVFETLTKDVEPVSSEAAVDIGPQLAHFPTFNESGPPIISTSFHYVKHQVQMDADNIAEIEEEEEVEEIRSSSESVDAETPSFDGVSTHMKGSYYEDRKYKSEDYDGDTVESQEYEDVEHREGFREYDDESRGYSRSPTIPVEEDESEDECEINEKELEVKSERILREDMEADVQEESSEEKLYDTASNVAEDEYDNMEDDEQYEEEFEEEYESDHVYEEEYEKSLSTDSESEDAPSTRPLESAPQRTIHPEVIVLDSDSEEELHTSEDRPLSPQEDEEAVLLETTEMPEQTDSLISSTAQVEAPHEIPENEEDTKLSETGEGQQNSQRAEIEFIAEADIALRDKIACSQEEIRSPSEESRRSASHAFFTPEADLGSILEEHDRNATDPELLRAQVASRTARDDSDDAHHRRDRSLQSEGSPNLSQHANQGLFLDGPSSPQVSSQVESHRDRYILFHSQSPTPNATQQTEPVSQEPDFQIVKSEPMPTPQATQDSFTEEFPEQPMLPNIKPSTHLDVAFTESNDHKRANIVDAATRQGSRSASTDLSASQRDLAVVDDGGLVRERQLEIRESIEDGLHLFDRRSVQVSMEFRHAEGPTTPPSLPDRQARGLRSAHSYFAPLATLFDLFNSVIDTISVVVETSPPSRATSGPRDYFLTVQLTDPSMAGTALPAQIFRPYKMVLPSVAEGDVILLRNFKVRTFNHSMMLLSTDSSARAVFDGKTDEARVTGPPVEYGTEEHAYADSLYRWYHENGAAMVADYRLQSSIDRGSRDETPSSSAAVSETGSMDSGFRESRGDSLSSIRGSRRGRKSNRRITIHELRDGTRYTEVGSPSDKESIHELRDGTVYANL